MAGDDLEASAARISSQFLQPNIRATQISPIDEEEEEEKKAQPSKASESAPSKGGKRAGRKAMKAQFLQGQQTKMTPNPQVGEISSLRSRILSLSLFPNLHNRSYLMKEGSTTS